jgi:hypothetical protein
VSADLLTALEEASKTCSGDTRRYGLSSGQLRGTIHQVVATNGHQLLIPGGFGFPWDGDMVVRGSPIFAGKAFPRNQQIHVAKTETHVLLKLGQWTIVCEIQKQRRFPKADDAVPANESITTRVQFGAEDARFFETALDRLPGRKELNSPATIDLNGKVTIRARETEQSQITELVLNCSNHTGSPISANTNRSILRRALSLGSREIGFASVESPIVCPTRHAIYAWQPLSGNSAIEPAADVQRIESSPVSLEPEQETTLATIPRRTMNEPARRNGQAQKARPESNDQASTDSPGSNLDSLIHEAEALQTTLVDARSSPALLIAGLRKHLRPSRILSDTLRSLRQLKQTDVPE